MGKANINKAIETLRSNVRQPDKGVEFAGIFDNDETREALGVILSTGALEQQGEAAEPVALRYTLDGTLAECPCCGSLDVGAAGGGCTPGGYGVVDCYNCGLSIKREGPMQAAIDAWNARAGTAPPAQAARVPDWLMEKVEQHTLTAGECPPNSKVVLLSSLKRINAAPAPAETRCKSCDGTGDVHSLDGEWRGNCTECEPSWIGIDMASGPDQHVEMIAPAPAEKTDGLTVHQEPKYTVSNGRIVNRVSGEAIPDDEPVFIFRARDRHSGDAIKHYALQLTLGDHRDAVINRLADFRRFSGLHPDRMKEPDTAPADATASLSVKEELICPKCSFVSTATVDASRWDAPIQCVCPCGHDFGEQEGNQ